MPHLFVEYVACTSTGITISKSTHPYFTGLMQLIKVPFLTMNLMPALVNIIKSFSSQLYTINIVIASVLKHKERERERGADSSIWLSEHNTFKGRRRRQNNAGIKQTWYLLDILADVISTPSSLSSDEPFLNRSNEIFLSSIECSLARIQIGWLNSTPIRIIHTMAHCNCIWHIRWLSYRNCANDRRHGNCRRNRWPIFR